MTVSNKTKKAVSLILGLAFLILISIYLKPQPPIFYSGLNKIWAHRGLSITCSENTKESTALAFKNGFPGVEMDIWYNEKLNLFEVKHDKTYNTKLFLNEILKQFNKPNHRFWLDLKNLSNSNEAKIISLLKNLNKKYKIKKRVIIEAPKASCLNKIKEAGFFTSLYLKPIKNVSVINNIKNNIINVINMYFYNFNAISLPADSYVGIYRFLYKKNNVHLWKFTKNKKDLKKWERMREVKIILFDGKL